MIGKNGRRDRLSLRLVALTLAAIAGLLGSAVAGSLGVAQAALIPEEEHWNYHIDNWLWDEERRKTYGIITPQVIIQNETADRLEGYVADANGTRLAMYDGDQVVNIRYISENSTGIASGWQIVGRVHDGYFGFDMPERYRDAEIVKIHIGNNEYTVDNGTPFAAQTQVLMNAAILNYRTNSTLDQEIQVAQAEQAEQPEEEPRPVRDANNGGSLIDWILGLTTQLPVRGTDSGE